MSNNWVVGIPDIPAKLHIHLSDGWHIYDIIRIEGLPDKGPPGRYAIVVATPADLELYMEGHEDSEVQIEDWYKDGELMIALDQDKEFEWNDNDLREI
jgi:hypothetical protein